MNERSYSNQNNLISAIGDRAAHQADIAKMYAEAIIETNGNWNCADINQIIKNRWSPSGLERIKKMAWKIVDAVAHGKDE